MTVELIPVIEADFGAEGVAAALASTPAFAPGTDFYRAALLDLPALSALTKVHLRGYFDGDWPLAETCPFFGGYVLRMDGQNALFPQCCGELSDIIYWKHLARYGQPAYYHGHPAPLVTFTADEVVFTCQAKDESFQPATAPEIRVAKSALAAAYERALAELEVFSQHLRPLQPDLPLPVGNIVDLLIYRNSEFPGEAPV